MNVVSGGCLFLGRGPQAVGIEGGKSSLWELDCKSWVWRGCTSKYLNRQEGGGSWKHPWKGSYGDKVLSVFSLALGRERESMLFDIMEPPCQEVIRCGVSQIALAEPCSPHRHWTCKELGMSSFRLLWFLWWGFLWWFDYYLRLGFFFGFTHENIPRPTLCDYSDFPYKPAFASCACLLYTHGRLWPIEYSDSGGTLSCLQLCSFIPASWDYWSYLRPVSETYSLVLLCF